MMDILSLKQLLYLLVRFYLYITHFKEISTHLKLKKILKEVNVILFAFLLKYFKYNISGGNTTVLYMEKVRH